MTEEEADLETERLCRGDKVYVNCGRNRVLGEDVWEVWVKDRDKRMETRFLLDDGSSTAKTHFRHVEALFTHFDGIHNSVLDRLRLAEEATTVRDREVAHRHEVERAEIARKDKDADADRRNKRLTVIANTFAALMGFTVCLATFAYVLFRGDAGWGPALLMCGSVLATCCTFLFGKFIMLKLEEVFGESRVASRSDEAEVTRV